MLNSYLRKFKNWLMPLKFLLAMIFLIAMPAQSATYNLSQGSYPPCSGFWVGSNCWFGRVTLGDGDIVIANGNATLSADNGFSLGTNTRVGSASVSINLSSDYGTITSGGNNTIFGSVNAGSGNVNLNDATISGTLRSIGNINLTGGSVSGLVQSTSNRITTNGTNLSGGASANSGLTITGGLLSGSFTAANNPIVLSGVSLVSGSISNGNTVTILNGSTLGSVNYPVSVSSLNGEIAVNNSVVYGTLTAPNYSTVRITNNGQVYGFCIPNSTPANACSGTPANICPNGFASGITGNYFNNMSLAEPVTSIRSDGPINFNWGSAAPGPTGIGADTFSVRWNGYIRATTSGAYRFRTVSDDGVRLYLNGNLIIDRWNDHSSTTDTSDALQLVAGQVYSLMLEYYENTGSSIIQLSWQVPGSSSYVAIPSGPTPTLGAGLYQCITVVKPPVSSCPTSLSAGITGKYFNNMSASGAVTATRLDGPINFDWSTGAPGPAGINANNFSVNWEGYLRVTQSGIYRFQTNSDDGVRLTINGDLLIDEWNDHSVTTHTSNAVNLVAGNSYPIKMEFYENGGYAVAQLLWQTPSGGSFVAIPRGSANASAAGLYDCAATPSGFSISHSAQGLTCAAEAVTFTALNASGGAFVPAAGTVVTLSANSANAAWVGGASYTFSGSESSFTKFLQQPTPAIVHIGISNGAVTANSTISFADVGLKIADSFSPLTAVKTQTAGIAGSAVLKVVRKDNNTGACVGQVGIGARPVSLGYTCNDPTTCIAGQVFSVNNTPIASGNTGSAVTYSTVSVNFNNLGEAPLTINYSDVGQVTLHAQLAITASGNNPAITLAGSSDPFVVKPYSIVIAKVQRTNLTNNPGGTTAAGAGAQFVAAGEPFRVEVEARNANAARTPNFGRELSPQTANLRLRLKNLIHPVGGTLTALSKTGAPSATTPQGTFLFNNVQWPQVGSITIEPYFDDEKETTTNDGFYLNAENIPNLMESSVIGRFYPDHFVVEGVSLQNACQSFTYMSQPSELSYTVQAKTANGNTPLTNYGPSYGAMPTITYVAESGNSGTDLGARFSDGFTKTWDKGVLKVDKAQATFSRLTSPPLVDGPYLDTAVGLRLTDNFDLRKLLVMDMNASTTGTCGSASCNAKSIGSPLNLRYGRLKLDDAFGPQTNNLPVNFYTEVWTGTRFVKNISDSCTQISQSAINFPAGNIAATANRTVALTGGNTTVNYRAMNATDVVFTNGDAGQFFSAPTANASGQFNISVNLTNYPWLRFDWNKNDAVPTICNTGAGRDADCDIRARIGFGMFRGHDRIIYWRERLN